MSLVSGNLSVKKPKPKSEGKKKTNGGHLSKKSTVQQHVERSFGLQFKKKNSQLFISIFALRLNPMRKVSTVT